jgi:Family of unknown function (DUF6328)
VALSLLKEHHYFVMVTLGEKIKLALDESRMLILGAQIILGIQYRAVFEKGFEALPRSSQNATVIGLLILLLAIALIMWPGAYHRIVREGNDAPDVHTFTTRVMNVALLPFLLALGIEVYVISAKLLGFKAGLAVGSATAVVAFVSWYGLGILSGRAGWDSQAGPAREGKSMKAPKTEIFDKVEQVLIEARVVLPGAQALLGFQFATMLIEGFDKLPESSKLIHLSSLLLMALSVILLMTPAAYHRIVEKGQTTEHFHRVASAFVLAAMVTLPLGICGDLFVVMRKVSGSILSAGLGAALVLSLFYFLWFGVTTYKRVRLRAQ